MHLLSHNDFWMVEMEIGRMREKKGSFVVFFFLWRRQKELGEVKRSILKEKKMKRKKVELKTGI